METKNETSAKKEPAKIQPAQGSNKVLFWILGGCLGLLVIGGLIVAGFTWWGYNKIKKEIKAQQSGMTQPQSQMASDKQNNVTVPTTTTENIPEEPAVQPPAINPQAAPEGTTQYVGEKQIGYIKKVYTTSGKNYLNIDYIQWLTGDAAEKAMREDGQCPKTGECIVYDDYYIRNQNPLVRTFEISLDAKIVMQTYDAEKTGIVMNNQEISFGQLKSIFSSGTDPNAQLKDVPYIVEISNQQIVKITEQYIP